MRNPWHVLGLERGADRVEVRRAYARRLKQTNPEDDPQGFMQLRQAYEWLLDHLEYAAADFDDYRVDAPTVHRDEAAEAPAAEESPVNPWAAVLEADPDEVEIDRLLGELGAHLATAGDEGRQRSREQVAAILAHPALARLDVAARVEHQLAHIILQHLPFSDAIILQAVDAFDWTDQRRAHEFPFSGIIARLDEWQLIHSLERSEDELHTAWRLLTRPGSTIGRWWHSRSERREQVAELLNYADYSAPGLSYSMDPEAVAWWRSELQKDRLPAEPLLWRLAGGILLAFALPRFGLGQIASLVVAAVITAALIGDLLAARHVLARWEWRERPFWQIAAAIVAFLAVPPLLLSIPLSWPVTGATILVVVAIVWAARHLLGNPTGVPRERRWATALGLGALLILASVTDDPVPLAQFLVLAAVAWLLILNLPLLRPVAAGVADRLTRGWGWPLMAVYGVGMMLFAWGSIDDPGQVPLVRIGIAAIACLAAGGVAAFAARPIPPFVLGLMLVFANGSVLLGQAAMLDDAIFNSATAGEAIASVDKVSDEASLTQPQRQALKALREMERRNPNFHFRIQTVLAGADKDAAARKLDRLIGKEVVRLLPASSNSLIAQHERLKADILEEMWFNQVAACAAGELSVGQESSPELHSRSRQLFLEIVGQGVAEPGERIDVEFPDASKLRASTAAFQKDLDSLPVPPGGNPRDYAKCAERLAAARALAILGDGQIATIKRAAAKEQPEAR